MTAQQPAWMGPLIQSDSRLPQAIRLSVSNSYCPTQTVNYGNGHGIAVMAGTATQIKYRIASGNAEHNCADPP